MKATELTDFSKSLEELTGQLAGDPKDAPTPLVERIWRSWKKPLNRLSDEEIGRLIVQHDGFPFVLDLVWPKLLRDPLYEGGYYPGDVLSNLIRADDSMWLGRSKYQSQLGELYKAALARPIEESDAFLDSLGIPSDQNRAN